MDFHKLHGLVQILDDLGVVGHAVGCVAHENGVDARVGHDADAAGADGRGRGFRLRHGAFHVAEGGQPLAAELFHGGLFLRDARAGNGRTHDHGPEYGGNAGDGDGLVHAAHGHVFGPGVLERKDPHDDLFRLRGFKGGHGAAYLIEVFRGAGHGNDISRFSQRRGKLRGEHRGIPERVVKLPCRAGAGRNEGSRAFFCGIEMQGAAQGIPAHVKGVLHSCKEGHGIHVLKPSAHGSLDGGRNGGRVPLGLSEAHEHRSEFLMIGIVGKGMPEGTGPQSGGTEAQKTQAGQTDSSEGTEEEAPEGGSVREGPHSHP